MKVILSRILLLFWAILLFCNSTQAQKNLCDVEDVGVLAPNEFKTKVSLTHVWQGAVGGINTKNADRINGLYDFDLYYLLSAEESEKRNGDYILVAVSTQAAFGNGLNDSKVGSFFEINETAKGDLNLIVDKLFVEFTALDRLFTIDVGKLDLVDFFDTSAVANCEKSQFLAAPLVNNSAIPFPSKGLGLRVLYEPSNFWYAQAVIADAQADKRETGFNTAFHDEDYFFSMAEIGIRPNLLNMPDAYRLIAWYDPQDKPYLDDSGNFKRDDLGLALSFDQKITDDTTVFFRYGWADDKVNEVEDFISFGGQIQGLIDGRDSDILAMAYVNGLRSPEGLSGSAERQIDMVEVYYDIKINNNIHLTPSIQFVMDPGGVTNESPATVLGLRSRIKF